MWLKDNRCEGVVHSTCDMSLGGDLVCKVMRKASDYYIQLKLWDKNILGMFV